MEQLCMVEAKSLSNVSKLIFTVCGSERSNGRSLQLGSFPEISLRSTPGYKLWCLRHRGHSGSFPEVPLRHLEGMQTFSRWLSVAIPPENKHPTQTAPWSASEGENVWFYIHTSLKRKRRFLCVTNIITIPFACASGMWIRLRIFGYYQQH